MAAPNTYKPQLTANQPGGSSIVDQNFNAIEAALNSLSATGTDTTTIAVKTGTYSIMVSDVVVLMNPSGATANATLPDAGNTRGKVFYIKNISQTATVTVSPRPKQLIDNSSSAVSLASLQHVTAVSDGSNFWII